MPKYSVQWSDEAKSNHLEILTYIAEKWGYSAAIKFDQQVESLLTNLCEFEMMCPASKKIGLRKCTVTEQTSLIYEIKDTTINLITLVDNRSNHDY